MKHGNKKERRGLTPLRLRGAAGDSVRQDDGNHLIVSHPNMARRCKDCKGRSSFSCDRCAVGLHPQCFYRYHTG